MEIDFLEEIGVKKVQRQRIKPTHRWTDSETIKMLEGICTLLRVEPNAAYERPTAKRFYDKLREKYFTEGEFDYIVLKSKMRHLKHSYVKARDWKENVGTELYASDQKYVNAKIKKMCPFYNLLDEIFGATLNSDPIGFRVVDDYEKTSVLLNKTNKRQISIFDNSEELVVPKVETNYNDHFVVDEQEREDDETIDTTNNDYEASYTESAKNGKHFSNHEKKTNSFEGKKSSINLNIEEKKFQLEKQKFQVYYEFESRRINLEERKFKYEKEKFERMQEMRKYEIDKQYEIKKIEIETNQRLKMLELDKTVNDLNQVMVEKEKKSAHNFEVEVMIDELEAEEEHV